MNQIDAIQRLMRYDRKEGTFVFTKDDLRAIFREDSAPALDAGIIRLIESGVLLRTVNGVYVNTLSIDKTDAIEHIARAMRRGEYSYVSLESALSEYGVISQVPMRLTVMTSGRRGVYRTPFGAIEFTHTARHWLDLIDGMVDVGRPLRLATKQTAYRDLKRVGRNLHLVDKEALYEDD